MEGEGSPPRRVLLKLSGEALMGGRTHGVDPELAGRIAAEIAEAARAGVALALVVGGGNLFRGADLAARGMDRVVGDHVGMLATVMNALVLRELIAAEGVPAEAYSAMPMGAVCETYSPRAARAALARGAVALLAGGTGNPFFTTDTAAALRAAELGAGLMLKATKVDGVYSADPARDPQARRYERLSYDEVLARGLGVMDLSAVVLCRDHGIRVRVFNVFEPGELVRAARGEAVGTLVDEGEER